MKKPIIAIDGYSSTGKSSVSKIIADKLNLIHLDTGALYRGVAFFAIENCADGKDKINTDCLIQNLDQIHLEFQNENSENVLYLNGKNINNEIRQQKVSDLSSSVVAKIKEVRDFLTEMQRILAQKGGIIVDGRDIGTVVLPDADYKFFLTASVEERAKRRFAELQSKGEKVDFEKVKKGLIERDKNDTERALSPLKQAEDAVLIDNTNLNKRQTQQLILSYLK